MQRDHYWREGERERGSRRRLESWAPTAAAHGFPPRAAAARGFSSIAASRRLSRPLRQGLVRSAAMAPSYDPHRLHPPARHRSTPYDPPADAHPRTINQSTSIPAKGPDADLFWMNHYYGQVWDDGDDDSDDDSDDPEKQPLECQICNRESNHTTLDCPFMVLTRQDILMRTPQVTRQLDYIMRTPSEVRFNYCHMEDDECIGGSGLAFDRPPGQRNVECCAADAMMLHKDGINMVRITGLPKVVEEPELVYQLFVKIGAVTNVVVFPDHALAFVNFVSEEAAQTAIKRFTGSDFGRIMWATQKPY